MNLSSESSSVASAEFDEDDLDTGSSATTVTAIALSDSGTTVSGSGAVVSGGIVTISEAGYYEVAGSLSNGQLVVAAADDAVVHVMLNAASISCSTSAPLYIKACDKTVITLGDAANSITATYTAADGAAPDAAIYSDSDLTINGNGSLEVDSSCIGIKTTDVLKIVGGELTVGSSADGIRGRDCIAVSGGTINVTASGGDGLSSNNDEDSSKGLIQISGGTFELKTGGGSTYSASSASTKGIKAVSSIAISGGAFIISSSDDAIHCNEAIAISGGSFDIAANSSTGQGIKFGDSSYMTVSGDATSISISSSLEGIAGYSLTIDGSPTIDVAASDDGLSISAGTDAQNGSDGSSLVINGGRIIVSASTGDGVDSNGTITMNGGTLIVNGPSSAGAENSIDHNGSFAINGGTVLALAGGSQMSQTSPVGSQSYASFTLSGTNSTYLHIQASSDSSGGIGALTFLPSKSFQSVLFSSPDLAKGTYYVYTAGNVQSGVEEDGLYTSGSYSGGTQRTSFVIK